MRCFNPTLGVAFASVRRDYDLVGMLVTRFGIRWIEEDIALSGWRLRKEPW